MKLFEAFQRHCVFSISVGRALKAIETDAGKTQQAQHFCYCGILNYAIDLAVEPALLGNYLCRRTPTGT